MVEKPPFLIKQTGSFYFFLLYNITNHICTNVVNKKKKKMQFRLQEEMFAGARKQQCP